MTKYLINNKLFCIYFGIFFTVLNTSAILLCLPQQSNGLRSDQNKSRGKTERFVINIENYTLIQEITREYTEKTIDYYIQNCLGSDFVTSKTGFCINQSGFGLMAIDSLDTLYIMRLDKEYDVLRDWIKTSFTCKKQRYFRTKELFTNVIGGLLSIYYLTNDVLYLRKIKECSDLIQVSFENSNTPFPYSVVNLHDRKGKNYKHLRGHDVGAASSYINELYSLSRVMNIIDVDNNIRSFLTLMEGYFKNKIIPSIVDYRNYHSFVDTVINDRSSLMLINILKYCIQSRGKGQINRIIEDIIALFDDTDFVFRKYFKKLYDKDSIVTFENICELRPLLIYMKKNDTNMYKILDFCLNISRKKLPSYISDIGGKDVYINDQVFYFSTSMIQEYLIQNKSLKTLPFSPFLEDCIFRSKFSTFNKKHEFSDSVIPSVSISRWAKYLFLDEQSIMFDHFIFNEVGHLIPIFN